MNSNDKLKLAGRLNIVVRGPDGNIKEEKKVENLVVTNGLVFITQRMAGTAAAVMSHMEVGSGTATAAAADTALGTAISRVTLAGTTTTTSGTTARIVYTATYAAGTGTGAVTEAGIFNSSTAGTMLCRTQFPVVNKGTSDTMAITWTVNLTAS